MIRTALLGADEAGIAQAAALLRAGQLVAFGTETVYGLGADATNAQAVASVFAAKGRPQNNPLICHAADADAAFAEVLPDDRARALAAAFWPGPLTLVLPRHPASRVARAAGAGADSLAMRVPAPAIARYLLRAAGRPIAAPSANRSGRVSPTTSAHVLEELAGRIAAVLECGACTVGVESTVLGLTGARPVLLRPGGVPADAIAALIGALAAPEAPLPGAILRSPGLLASHYAPALPVRLAAQAVAGDEALLAFGPVLPGARVVFQLSAGSDLAEAAQNLFAGLRWLDQQGQALGLRGIAAMPVPYAGLGQAINDRLARAAAPRPEGSGPNT